jgi:hypothetical protein
MITVDWIESVIRMPIFDLGNIHNISALIVDRVLSPLIKIPQS